MRPTWWNEGFTAELLASELVGKSLVDAMYTVFACDLECLVRTKTPPIEHRENRIQLFVSNDTVVNAIVG